MTKIGDKGTNKVEEMSDFPSCYANYCKNHDACHHCEFKDSCKAIKKPKEPGWCQ